jgi:hypothetical protein
MHDKIFQSMCKYKNPHFSLKKKRKTKVVIALWYIIIQKTMIKGNQRKRKLRVEGPTSLEKVR